MLIRLHYELKQKIYYLFAIHIFHHFQFTQSYVLMCSLQPTSVMSVIAIVPGARAFSTFCKINVIHTNFAAHLSCTPKEAVRSKVPRNPHSGRSSHLQTSRNHNRQIYPYTLHSPQFSLKSHSPYYGQLQNHPRSQCQYSRPRYSLCLYIPHGLCRLISLCNTRGKHHPRRPCRPRCPRRQRRPLRP